MHPTPPDGAMFAGAWAALLCTPLGAIAATWEARCPAGSRVEWLTVSPGGARPPPPAAGWLLLRLGDEAIDGPALRVATAHALEPSDPQVQMASSLCRAAWRLQGGDTAPPLASDLSESMHALRNALNSTAMNAAVLVSRKAELPDGLHANVSRVEAGSMRCGQELNRLLVLLDAMA